MTTLGVVLAGGRSTRFGSDKAQARLCGLMLIDHALATVAKNCDSVAVVGRYHTGVLSLDDWPSPGLGPLGAIAGALRHARAVGHDYVLSVPVDCIFLNDALVSDLSPAPACSAAQPVIGLWPTSELDSLSLLLRNGTSRSMRAFADKIGARRVPDPGVTYNINTCADLLAAEAEIALSHGDRSASAKR